MALKLGIFQWARSLFSPKVDTLKDGAIAVIAPINGLADAVSYLTDAVKTEEARFNNLNTRAIAIVSACSVVASLIGIGAKDVVEKATSLDSSAMIYLKFGIEWGLVALACTALAVVFGVLFPSKRFSFLDNAIIPWGDETKRKQGSVPSGIGNHPLDTSPAGESLDPSAAKTAAYKDYVIIYLVLLKRNMRKAAWLQLAYALFVVAIGCIAVTTILALPSV